MLVKGETVVFHTVCMERIYYAAPCKSIWIDSASRFLNFKLTRLLSETFMFLEIFYLPFKDLFYELECLHMYVFIILSFYL